MRGYELDLTAAFNAGIVPDADLLQEGRFFTDIRETYISAGKHRVLSMPSTVPGFTFDFPFPHILADGKIQTVVTRTGFKRRTFPGTFTNLSLLDDGITATPSFQSPFLGNASLGEFVCASNDEYTVVSYGIDLLKGNTQLFLCPRRFNAAAQHRGRVIFGGSPNFTGTALEAAFLNIREEIDATLPPNRFGSQGDFVFWTAPVDMRFLYAAVFPANSTAIAGLDISPETLRDQTRTNLWGWAYLPNIGNILSMAPLAERVIIYGTNGIYALTLAGYTYGVSDEQISSVGVGSKSLAVTPSAHYFASNYNTLYRTTARGIERLGFKGLFAPDFIPAYDSEQGVFLSSFDPLVSTLIINPDGVTQSVVKFTGVFRQGTTFQGFRNNPSRNFYARTHRMGLNSYGSKTLQQVGIVASDAAKVSVRGLWASTVNEDLKVGGDWKQINRERTAYPGVTANFIAFEAEAQGLVAPSQITFVYQSPERQHTRHASTIPTNARTNGSDVGSDQ